MANERTAAIMAGEDYQAYHFWLNAFKMLLPSSNVASVVYEDDSALPFDDVAIYYNSYIRNESTATQYDREFIQCKFKVDQTTQISYSDLINPDYYKNKDSLLKRAYDFYSQQSDDNFIMVLCTSVLPVAGDPLFEQIDGHDHGLRLSKIQASAVKKVKTMIAELCQHLGVNNVVLYAFLTKLRFRFGKSIHELKKELHDLCCILEIAFDLSKDAEPWTSLLKKINLRKTQTTADTIRTICIQENLYSFTRTKIGITTFSDLTDPRVSRQKCLGDKCLDLSCLFSGRKISAEYEWSDVVTSSKKFVSENLEHGKSYTFDISTIYSVAFMIGKQIGFKIGDIALKNRDGLWIKNMSVPVRIIEENIEIIKDSEQSDDVIVCISVGSSIIDDVKSYLKIISLSGSTLDYKYGASCLTNNMVWDFANSVNITIKQFLRDCNPERIHIFFRGPAELMFIFGQYSNEWGQCQIYDYNFNAKTIKEQQYIKGICI